VGGDRLGVHDVPLGAAVERDVRPLAGDVAEFLAGDVLLVGEHRDAAVRQFDGVFGGLLDCLHNNRKTPNPSVKNWRLVIARDTRGGSLSLMENSVIPVFYACSSINYGIYSSFIL